MITSGENKHIKQIIQLNSKSKTRKKTGLFVVEGTKMFLEAPKEQIEMVYVSESFYTSEQGMDVLKQKGDEYTIEGELVQIVADKVFLQACDTLTPQGILTVVKQRRWSMDDMFPNDGKQPFLIVLDGLQDPGNLGTILRTGEGAGITGVIMSKTTVDTTNPKTIRATMGSVYRIPQIVAEDLEDIIRQIKERGVTTYAAHLHGKKDFYDENYEESCAFFIGNEGNGLSDEVARLADHYVKIPMEGNVESLNAAVAASIMMYECKRQRGLA